MLCYINKFDYLVWIFIKKKFIVILFLFFDLVLDNFDVENFKIY